MKFRKSFEVRFSEADRRSVLTPIALFNYLQEAAIGHGDAVGMDGETLEEMGYVWMLNRLHIRVEHYPRRRETVHVETWGSTLTGLYAVREWNVTDDTGQTIVSATARWIIFDAQKRKIIKLPDMLAERYTQYGALKVDTAEAVIDLLVPIQQRFAELAADPGETARLLRLGADKAREVATPIYERARTKMGFLAP